MSTLKLGMAQIAPVWLDKDRTIDKVITYIEKAAADHCDLVIFGESLLPGYPFWLSLTHGAAFNDRMQKEIHAHYLKNSICIEEGDLAMICDKAKSLEIAIYLGIIERPLDRGGHSVYCSLVYIDKHGEIKSVHRKLQPTYEERLSWSPGDGHGLVTHKLEGFTVGGLNCWENWMPLSRMALYAQGEIVHVGVWPGGLHNTHDLPKFIAKEGRVFSVHVSGLMRMEDIPKNTPYYGQIIENCPDLIANGASCIASPNGEWIIEPQVGEEGLYTAELDMDIVYQERQNFDAVGHYSRPDVTRLVVNRDRQGLVGFE